MKVGEAIQILSQRRRFHVVVFTLLALNFMFIPVHEFIDLFLMFRPAHHCRFPANDSIDQWIPYDPQTHKHMQCHMFAHKLTESQVERERERAGRSSSHHCHDTVWDWKSLKFQSTGCKSSEDHHSEKLVIRRSTALNRNISEHTIELTSERTVADNGHNRSYPDYSTRPGALAERKLRTSHPKQLDNSERGKLKSDGEVSNHVVNNNGVDDDRVEVASRDRVRVDHPSSYKRDSLQLKSVGYEIVACTDGVVFDKSAGTTLITEFNLTCDNDVSAMANAVMGVAMVTGAVVFAPFVDKYGRKTLFMMVWCQNCLLSLGIALVKHIHSYWVLRFLSRFYIEGVEIAILVLAVEMLPSRARPLAPLILYLAYALGQVVLSLQAMLFRSWWQLQLAVSIETIVMVPLSWFLIPESMHWLVSMRRTRDAEKLVRLGCRVNGIVLPADFHLDPIETGTGEEQDELATGDGYRNDRHRNSAVERLRHKQLNLKNRPGAGEYLQHEFHAHVGEWRRIYSLMQNQQLRRHFFIVAYMWAIVGFLYYGLTVSTMTMKGNLYMNYSLSGLVMVPASVSIFILRRFGRKKPILYFLIGAGVSTTISLICPYKTPDGTDIYLVSLTMKLAAKYCVVSCLISIRLLIIELFPTPVRGSLIGLTALVGLLGSAFGYYFSTMIEFSKWVGVAVGALTLLAAALSQLLPETSNRPLPDTIHDIMTACSEMFKTLLVTLPTAPPATSAVSGGEEQRAASHGAAGKRFISLSAFSLALSWKARGAKGRSERHNCSDSATTATATSAFDVVSAAAAAAAGDGGAAAAGGGGATATTATTTTTAAAAAGGGSGRGRGSRATTCCQNPGCSFCSSSSSSNSNNSSRVVTARIPMKGRSCVRSQSTGRPRIGLVGVYNAACQIHDNPAQVVTDSPPPTPPPPPPPSPPPPPPPLAQQVHVQLEKQHVPASDCQSSDVSSGSDGSSSECADNQCNERRCSDISRDMTTRV